MKWLSFLVGVSIVLLLSGVAQAREVLEAVQQEARAEIAIDRNDQIEVFPLGEHGVLVAIGRRKGGATRWSLQRYDTDLRPDGAPMPLELPEDAWLRDWSMDDGACHLLFQENNRRRVDLIAVPLSGGAPTAWSWQVPHKVAVIKELAVVGGDAYLRGLRGSTNRLWHVSLTPGSQPQALEPPTGSPRKVGFQRIVPSAMGDEVDVVVSNTRRRRRTMDVLGYTDGVLRSQLRVVPEEGAGNLITAQRSPLADGSTLVLGTYSATEKGLGAQGIYVARYEGEQRTAIHRHSFSDFPGFASNLAPKREERLNRRAERKKAKGEDLQLSYSILLHDVIESGGQLLLIGEAYTPVYQTYTRTVTTTVNGQTQTRVETYQVLVGWRTYQTFIAALDTSGALLWSESFPIRSGLQPRPTEQVRVQLTDDRVSLRYAVGDALYTRQILSGESGSGADAPREGERQEVGAEEGERVRRSGQTDLQWWYGDHFLLWGEQALRSEEEGAHRVFFFSRISAEAQ